MKLLRALTVAALAAQTAALSIGGKNMIVERGSDGLQSLVSSSLGAIESSSGSNSPDSYTSNRLHTTSIHC